MAGQIKSDIGTANDAVSKYGNLVGPSTKISALGESNLSGMKSAVTVSNKIVSDVSSLQSSIKKQAGKFPKLASAIEQRDKQDATALLNNTWGW